MNKNAFIYLVFMLMKFSYSKLSEQCEKSNTFWNSIKYPYNDILKISSTQSHVFTCPQTLLSHNCCDSGTNKDMADVSKLKLRGFAEDKIENILMMLSNDSYDLMNLFIKDLENTKNDLHQLFSTTYGYNYKVHKTFFFTWFEKLKQYMQGDLKNMAALMDNFFLEMVQTIIRILIAPDSTPETATCHTMRFLESKPYQDTDVLLKKKIMSSYPPARLLVNGLAVGRDVFNDLSKNISPSTQCIEDFNTAFHCMFCQGLTLKPCSQRCSSLIDNCFGSYKSSDIKRLDKAFTKYIKTIVQLAGRLDNPFNFPEVNNKMNVQISTAIMNIQTMYPIIKEQIIAKCKIGSGGTPTLPMSRKRRQASQEFYKWQNSKGNEAQSFVEQASTRTTNEDYDIKKKIKNYQIEPNDSLSFLAKKMKQKYKSLENYFKNQKNEYCSSVSVKDVSEDCWNGTAIVKNIAPRSANQNKKKRDNVEDSSLKSALGQLSDITNRINSYLNATNLDPETMPVKEYKLYASQKLNTPARNRKPNLFGHKLYEKLEGSGEIDSNKLEKPNLKPTSEPQGPQTDKISLEFPTFSEGSAETENKQPGEKRKKISQVPRNVNFGFSKYNGTATLSSVNIGRTKPLSINQIPDDEDLNPPSQEIMPKGNLPINTISTVSSIIQPEGSGNHPNIPDLSPNKPQVLPSITTAKPLEPVIDGSGDDFKSKPSVKQPGPFLPMLPDSQKSSSKAPKRSDYKPDPIPDQEVLPPVDGSGKGSNQPSVLTPIEPIDGQQPTKPATMSESTKQSIGSSSPEQYPGKVPSEVWLPGLRGVKDQQKGRQKTTPSGQASKHYRNDLKTIIYRTMFIIVVMYKMQ